MPLDINGVMANDILLISKRVDIAQEQTSTNLIVNDKEFNKDIVLKIMKYFLFLASIILNIILFRKLKSYRYTGINH
jgi:hypothetical protein